MKKQRVLLALLGLLVGWGGASIGQAATSKHPAVTFQATDEPGTWFHCSTTGHTTSIGCVPESVAGKGQKSLAVIHPGETIGFASIGGKARTIHTAVSLLYPTGAFKEPFDVDLEPHSHGGLGKPFTVTLTDPGLYVFFCDIHVYMFAAVIVDDPATPELDLGKTVDLPSVTTNGITGLPTASDLALRLVHTFFIYTNPHNWQFYPISGTAPWAPLYPHVPVLAYDKDGNPVSVFLDAAMQGPPFNEPKTLSAPVPPSAPGVGEVWVDTQFETIREKTKPGTATAVNATTFQVERKVALPHINMNNPHNMWTDKDQKVIYQTQWFDEYLTVFDRTSGKLVRNLPAGPAPAHVMTRTNNDQVHVSQNGGNDVREFGSLVAGNGFIRDIPMGTGPGDTHPHGHFMSANGQMMVTPNEDADESALFDFIFGLAQPAHTGHSPIATGMMPDSSKYYVANFLDSTLSVIGITQIPGNPPTINKLTDINLLGNYDPIGGSFTGFVGALPIQTPVSPDGRFVVTANALTSTILVIDTSNDTVVAMLPCDAGCHGVQFGAKKDGGYYAYVGSKFSNRMLVIDPDPNGVGVAPDNGSNSIIAGSVLLTTANKSSAFHSDGTVIGNAGMGGQGVLPIPVVYNGWVQNLPQEFKDKLTNQQKHPIGVDPQ